MRHRVRGRKLGRNASHRRAMFRNMASSLIKSVRVDEDAESIPDVPGRIVTTVPKAKELRPYVEKLITMARKAQVIANEAARYGTDATPQSDEWKTWRSSDQWNQWTQAMAPAINLRRRAFSLLRDQEAVDVLFTELAERFADRDGGYTRVIRLAEVRLGDAGAQALIEFVGERDRKRTRRAAPVVSDEPADESPAVEDESDDAADEAPEAQAEVDSDADASDAAADEEEKPAEEG